jgi:hypothetical protein
MIFWLTLWDINPMPKPYGRAGNNSRDSGRFITVPVSVLDSATYQSLGFSARSLLIDIASQFKGENNGGLVACDKFLKPRGWTSKATISKALKELIGSGLLVMTRQGSRPNKASYFGLAWHGLGRRVIESDLDINGRTFELIRHQWKASERELKIKSQPPISGLKIAKIAPKNELRHSPISPLNEPIQINNSFVLPQNMGTL